MDRTEARGCMDGKKDARKIRQTYVGKLSTQDELQLENGDLKCPVCNKIYKTKQGFSNHYSRMHGAEEILRQEQGGILHCPLCETTSRSQATLTKHRVNAHENGLTYLTCNECGKECRSRNGFLLHCRRTHGIEI